MSLPMFDQVSLSLPAAAMAKAAVTTDASGFDATQAAMRRAARRSALGAIGLFLTCLSLPSQAAPERYEIDSSHAAVAFLVEHVGYARTLGRFTEHSGSFTWDSETRTLSDLSVVVQTDSVSTDHEQRDKHVRSDDFLNVEKYPTMTFEMTGEQVIAEDTASVEGQLTLRGVSQPLTLQVKLNKSDKYPFGHKKQTLGVSASGTLQRSAYGMEYAVGNGLVGDDVDLIIEIEANKQ